MFTQHEISETEHREWFSASCKDPSKMLLIYERNSESLGFVNFTIVGTNGVYWGFYTKPSAPAGSGSAMGRTALAYAFQEQGFEKVIGEAISFNEPSIRFHRKLGFKQEGTRTDRENMTEGPADIHIFGLSRSEWSARLES